MFAVIEHMMAVMAPVDRLLARWHNQWNPEQWTEKQEEADATEPHGATWLEVNFSHRVSLAVVAQDKHRVARPVVWVGHHLDSHSSRHRGVVARHLRCVAWLLLRVTWLHAGLHTGLIVRLHHRRLTCLVWVLTVLVLVHRLLVGLRLVSHGRLGSIRVLTGRRSLIEEWHSRGDWFVAFRH